MRNDEKPVVKWCRLPEQIKVVLFYMWQRLQWGVVQPAALDDHLYQVTDTDGCNEPTLTGSYIQQRLRRRMRAKCKIKAQSQFPPLAVPLGSTPRFCTWPRKLGCPISFRDRREFPKYFVNRDSVTWNMTPAVVKKVHIFANNHANCLQSLQYLYLF